MFSIIYDIVLPAELHADFIPVIIKQPDKGVSIS